MKLKIEFAKPIPLITGKRVGLIYTLNNLDQIPNKHGVYIFARRWGKSYEALYVGKSKNMRSRVRSHFNNLRLMKHLENAKTGKRFVIIGQAKTLPGQKMKTVLQLLERAFIRYFLAEGHDLVNQQGVRIRRHEITSDGKVKKSFIPSVMFLEKSK